MQLDKSYLTRSTQTATTVANVIKNWMHFSSYLACASAASVLKSIHIFYNLQRTSRNPTT